MRYVWVQAIPWDKEVVIAALESGADALVLAAGDSARAKELGVITTVAPDGDLRPEQDVATVEVTSRDDERQVLAIAPGTPVIVRTPDWSIIPLENLLAQRDNLLMEVHSLEEARTAAGILERGVDGLVIASDDPAVVRAIVSDMRQQSETFDLVEAEVTRVLQLTMGDRVCVDTCTTMQAGQGMLVGNSSSALFLVHAETTENPYVAPRPFRVNAGPVHAYVRVPGGGTRYLAELRAGDRVLIVDHTGAAHEAVVGRVKIEKRPLLYVEALAGEQTCGVILQNAETIRLTAPDGSSVSVVDLQPGSRVLLHTEQGGRHFGMAVDETIDEK